MIIPYLRPKGSVMYGLVVRLQKEIVNEGISGTTKSLFLVCLPNKGAKSATKK
jgi:hypothetical protein